MNQGNAKTRDDLDSIVSQYKRDVKLQTEKYKVLKDLDLFVLDNSIRESTVAQLRGHTIETKWEVLKEAKKCGFQNIIVASFSHSTRVDDLFIKELPDEYRDGAFAFSEITSGSKNKIPDTEGIPLALTKMKEGRIWNVVFEVDLSDQFYDFTKFSISDMCALVKKWIVWAHDELHKEAKVLINFRDLPDAMVDSPERCFYLLQFLATLPANLRPFGVIYEEPKGTNVPEECGQWAKYFRKVMDQNNWDGHLLVHVHEKYGHADTAVLEALMNGANGIWASVCREGAAMGHASSCNTIMNLVRLGNKKVLKKYNCQYIRKAAINVTKTTTGLPPHKNQPVYGTRALDLVFGMTAAEFDLAEFFGEEAPLRMSTMVSPEMIKEKLVRFFGESTDFTIEIATKMKEKIYEDLRNSRKEEYMSKAGLAVLFDRAGGSMSQAMRDEVAAVDLKTPYAEMLINDVRKQWDEWDTKEKVHGDNMLEYDSFYNGFMAPYFSCYRCTDTKKALQALDMDADNQVDWNEFLVYLKWAFRQYPDVKDANELVDIAFCKGIIPAMRDELLKSEKKA